jgi:hypothetical protein
MTENLILSTLSLEDIVKKVSKEVTDNILAQIGSNQPEQKATVVDEYVPKTEVRGVLASNSTLWQWEKSGKLKLYAIGGKRFYKRADIEALFTEVKK